MTPLGQGASFAVGVNVIDTDVRFREVEGREVEGPGVREFEQGVEASLLRGSGSGSLLRALYMEFTKMILRLGEVLQAKAGGRKACISIAVLVKGLYNARYSSTPVHLLGGIPGNTTRIGHELGKYDSTMDTLSSLKLVVEETIIGLLLDCNAKKLTKLGSLKAASKGVDSLDGGVSAPAKAIERSTEQAGGQLASKSISKVDYGA
ncbi:hypothetical protein DFH28DRAFT_927170 [Melampsora americana]|nr:hypothetical protein DFH28DRAFT_927170 [Melampsora americana]